MIIPFLKKIERKCFERTESFTRSSNFPLRLALLCCLITFVTGGDAVVSVLAGYDTLAESDTWQFLQKQIVSPLTTYSVLDPYHHTSKMGYRLLPPYIGKLCWNCSLKGQMLFLIGLEYLAGFLFFLFTYKLLIPYCKNKVPLTWLLLGLCFTFLGKIFFWDTYAYFDAYALLFLSLSLYTPSPVLIFLYLSLAFWTDERSMVASALVGLWWFMADDPSEKHAAYFGKFARVPSPRHWAIALALGVTFGLRWLLATQYGRPSVTSITQIIAEAKFTLIKTRLIELIPFVSVSSFESYWVYVTGAVVVLGLNRERWAAAFYLLAISASFGVSFLVYDMTRSIMYAFPALFIGIRIMARELPTKVFQRLALGVLFAAALYPTYYLSHYIWPFFARIVRFH